MSHWPNRRLLERCGIDVPIVQAPMAGASGTALALEVARAGGLGSLPCAMLDAAAVRSQLAEIRSKTAAPINVNFFCHAPYRADAEREARWRALLAGYYREHALEVPEGPPTVGLAPFDERLCELLEAERPAVVSFHFGLPEPALVGRLKAAGWLVMSSATTVREARWLETHGCDVVIAQGCEAGGHRAMFLAEDAASQPGTLALVPQIVDAVRVPVVAAGGIADGRGIAAAFALGAAGVQIGTAYLFAQESLVSPLHRQRLLAARDDETALTNVFTGRPARSLANRVMRELGPLTPAAPAFPGAGSALGPLKKAAEARGADDFSSLWCGQGAPLCAATTAAELTRRLAADALRRLEALGREIGGERGRA